MASRSCGRDEHFVTANGLFDRFGADAYHAVGDISQSVLPLYTEAVQESLRNAPCWPSRDVSRGKRLKVQFTSASKLNMVSDPSLDQFLNNDKYLHPALCKSEALRSLAGNYGVRKFTLNSLIRLRCAGKSPNTLQSKCGDEESNYYYTEFPADWKDVSIQQRCAAALDKNRNKLSQQNRSDLTSSERPLLQICLSPLRRIFGLCQGRSWRSVRFPRSNVFTLN